VQPVDLGADRDRADNSASSTGRRVSTPPVATAAMSQLPPPEEGLILACPPVDGPEGRDGFPAGGRLDPCPRTGVSSRSAGRIHPAEVNIHNVSTAGELEPGPNHGPMGDIHGREAFKELVAQWRSAVPDVHSRTREHLLRGGGVPIAGRSWRHDSHGEVGDGARGAGRGECRREQDELVETLSETNNPDGTGDDLIRRLASVRCT
jgi:hypothetical protein